VHLLDNKVFKYKFVVKLTKTATRIFCLLCVEKTTELLAAL